MFAFLKKLLGIADINKDGKVDANDARVVVNATKAAVQTAKSQAKKTTKSRKPKAKSTSKA